MKTMTSEEAFAGLAQGVINIESGHATIERESFVHRAMARVCELAVEGLVAGLSPDEEIAVCNALKFYIETKSAQNYAPDSPLARTLAAARTVLKRLVAK